MTGALLLGMGTLVLSLVGAAPSASTPAPEVPSPAEVPVHVDLPEAQAALDLPGPRCEMGKGIAVPDPARCAWAPEPPLGTDFRYWVGRLSTGDHYELNITVEGVDRGLLVNESTLRTTLGKSEGCSVLSSEHGTRSVLGDTGDTLHMVTRCGDTYSFFDAVQVRRDVGGLVPRGLVLAFVLQLPGPPSDPESAAVITAYRAALDADVASLRSTPPKRFNELAHPGLFAGPLIGLVVVLLGILVFVRVARARRFTPGRSVNMRDAQGRVHSGSVAMERGDHVLVRWDAGGESEVPKARLW
jgi:hypothetical protein